MTIPCDCTEAHVPRTSALRMRKTISLGQWYPWTAVSTLLGLISSLVSMELPLGQWAVKPLNPAEASAEYFFKRQLHRKQVVAVRWEL